MCARVSPGSASPSLPRVLTQFQDIDNSPRRAHRYRGEKRALLMRVIKERRYIVLPASLIRYSFCQGTRVRGYRLSMSNQRRGRGTTARRSSGIAREGERERGGKKGGWANFFFKESVLKELALFSCSFLVDRITIPLPPRSRGRVIR